MVGTSVFSFGDGIGMAIHLLKCPVAYYMVKANLQQHLKMTAHDIY
jgi:hypothetical protein